MNATRFARLVIVESPYAGDVPANIDYARECLRDCLSRGESPYASHLLLTQVLDDADPEERALGLEAAGAWRARAHATVVYLDHGISPGMADGIKAARRMGIPVEYRTLAAKERPAMPAWPAQEHYDGLLLAECDRWGLPYRSRKRRYDLAVFVRAKVFVKLLDEGYSSVGIGARAGVDHSTVLYARGFLARHPESEFASVTHRHALSREVTAHD